MILALIIFGQLDSGLFYLNQGGYANSLALLLKAESLFKFMTEKSANCTLFYYLSETDYRISNLYLQKEKKKDAVYFLELGIASAEKAISLNKNYSDGHSVLGSLFGEKITLSNNPFAGMLYGEKSRNELKKGIELDLNNPYAHLRMGISNLYTPKQWGGGVKKALISFLKAIELLPSNAEFFVWLGIAQKKRGDKIEAIKSFKKALVIRTDYVWAQVELDEISK